MELLLPLLLAHLLGDFVVQSHALIDGKRAGRWQAYAQHAAWHLACLLLAWLAFAPAGVEATAVAVAFAAIVALHVLVDLAKARWFGAGGVLAFALDQGLHLAVLVAAAWWLAGQPPWWATFQQLWSSVSGFAGWLLVAYLVAVVACGWFNAIALRTLLPSPSSADGEEGLARAGLYIGWLERFLMFSAFLAQAWAAIGLVLAAKSVFRFDSIRRGREHAEYFVIGTLLSVSEVVLIGLIARLLAPAIMGGL